jgi:TonB family protein
MAFLGPSLRRARVSERPFARLGVAVLLSLVANTLLVAVAVRMGAFELAKPVAEQRVVLAPLSADQWNHNRAVVGQGQAQPISPAAKPPPPLAVAPPPPKQPEVKPQGQIVDVAPSQNTTPPKESRFLSEHDSSVEKEMRSRDAGKRVYQNRAAQPTEGGPQHDRPAGEGGEAQASREAVRGSNTPDGTGAQKAPVTTPEKDKEKPDQLAMLEHGPSKEGLTETPPRLPPGSTARREEPQGAPGLPGAPSEAQRKLGDPRLLPSAASMAKVMAGPSNDALRGVEEGDATALNTRAFRFAGFWNRFKQDVASQWRPQIRYDERDPQRTTYAVRDRETALEIVLDAQGQLRSLKVVQSCGLDFLDNEAMRAVSAATPVQNPPSGVVDEHGEIRFTFGMVLVMDRVRSMRPIYPPGVRPGD